MITIKFRAWLTESKYMIEHNIIDFNDFLHKTNLDGSINLSYCGDDILMQFTGLHDKNGKEIYEGDWCCAKFMTKNDNKVIQGLIIMDEFMWCIDCTGNLGDDIFSINRIHDVEVIGNIYEDTELLNN